MRYQIYLGLFFEPPWGYWKNTSSIYLSLETQQKIEDLIGLEHLLIFHTPFNKNNLPLQGRKTLFRKNVH